MTVQRRIISAVLALVIMLSVLAATGVSAYAAPAAPDAFNRDRLAAVAEKGELYAELYDSLYFAALKGKTEVAIKENTFTVDEASVVYSLMRNDHPEMIWIDPGFGYYTYGEKIISLLPKYNELFENEKEIEKFDKAVKKLIAGVGGSDRDIALTLHDRLCERVVYDITADHCHDAYGAIVESAAVCEGYSRAYQYLLSLCGVEATTVVGEAGGEGHAWNLVDMDGSWTLVDVTWDSDEKNLYHGYFARTDSFFGAEHTPDELPFGLPACTDTSLGYYGSDKVLSALDADAVSAILNENKKGSLATAGFIYTGDEDITGWIQSNASTILGNIKLYGSVSVSYSTCADEVIMIFKAKNGKDVVTVGDAGLADFIELEEGDKLPVNTLIGTKYVTGWHDRYGAPLTKYSSSVRPFADYVESGMLGVRMQFKKIGNGKVTMRVLSSIDGLDAYSKVGWLMSLTDSDPTVGEKGVQSCESRQVYGGIFANGVKMTPAQVFKSSKYVGWAKYLYSYEIRGIPKAAATSPIYVRPYAVLEDGTVIYGTVKAVTVSDYVSLDVEYGDNEYYDNE